MNFVLDPSVAAKWFILDERSEAADAILDRIRGGDSACAPALFTWEMENLMLAALRSGRITAPDAEEALEALRDLPISLEATSDRFFAGSEMRLAQAYDLTAYDAAYLATALNLEAELVTADATMAKASRDLGLETTLV